MSNNESVRWCCPNRDCKWFMVAAVAEGDEAPQCVCGMRMHRAEIIPVFSYLNFLHDEVAVTEELGSKEE